MYLYGFYYGYIKDNKNFYMCMFDGRVCLVLKV